MPVNARFAKSALADLQAMQTWYNKQGVPEIGARLVEEIIMCVEHLAEHPDLGRVVPEFGQSFLREIIHPPFRIVYRRDSNAVRIVRIWRGERRLQLTEH
jgi:toxin ParE1/3/4